MAVSATHPDLHALARHLSSFATLPPSEADTLRRAIGEVRLAPGERMNPGTIGYVISGLMRAFYLDSEGRDRTKAFWSEDKLVYSLGATSATPGRSPEETLEDWTVEAVEESHLFVLALQDLDRLYGGDPCWNHIGRVFWQQAYREKLVRERQFLLNSATERYREFARFHPGLENRIPQYLIASYLGITPVALSRLRGRKKSSSTRPGRASRRG